MVRRSILRVFHGFCKPIIGDNTRNGFRDGLSPGSSMEPMQANTFIDFFLAHPSSSIGKTAVVVVGLFPSIEVFNFRYFLYYSNM